MQTHLEKVRQRLHELRHNLQMASLLCQAQGSAADGQRAGAFCFIRNQVGVCSLPLLFSCLCLSIQVNSHEELISHFTYLKIWIKIESITHNNIVSSAKSLCILR